MRWREDRVEFGLLGPLLVRVGRKPVRVSAGKQRVLLATKCYGRTGPGVNDLGGLARDGEVSAAQHAALKITRPRHCATLYARANRISANHCPDIHGFPVAVYE